MRNLVAIVSVLGLGAAVGVAKEGGNARPNVLVVMADDLGFSDLGCYGSEIETPNLDALANNGLRFSNFYNTAKCHSSRVSLLTGRYVYQAGNTRLNQAVTAAEVLKEAGYFTAMTGKWHLDKQPTDFGFDRYFGHLSGACNYYLGDNTFRLNGEKFKVPDTGFYTTVANVDRAIEFLGDARKQNEARQQNAKQSEQRPWYLYIAFNAPHAPLQPLEADFRKYEGRYDVGWDVIREQRLKKQTAMNLFGKPVEACERPEWIPAWDSMSKEWQTWESRRMAAYAALIDRVDQELGRLFADLKRAGEFENTFVLFVSDNGACPYDRRTTRLEGNPFDPKVTWSDSTGWAWARNSPFKFYKQNQFEGGCATPAIVHWPKGLKRPGGSLVHEPAHLVDVLPTLAEISGAKLPAKWPGRELTPVAGVSLAPVLAGSTLGERPPIHLQFGHDRGLRDGDWKLVSFRGSAWELYNLATDRAELNDLAAKETAVRDRLSAMWHEMATTVAMLPEKVSGPVYKAAPKYFDEQWTRYTKPADGSVDTVRKPKSDEAKAAKKARKTGQKSQDE